MSINKLIAVDRVNTFREYPAFSSTKRKVGNGVKVAKLLNKMRSHNSIAKMANDGIYQYPVLMSSSMNTEDAITIARAIEKQCAAFVVTAYSLYGTMDNKKYEDLGDFVKKFHSNKDIPSNFRAARQAFESNTEVILEDGDIAVESLSMYTINNPELQEVSKQCWGVAKEQLDMGALNDIYRPYDRTARIIEEKINTMKTATEGIGDVASTIGSAVNAVADAVDHNNKKNAINDANIGVYGNTDKRNRKIDHKVGSNYKNEVVRNDRLSALEPTIVNVTVTRHGTVHGAGPSVYMQTITLGVKAMVRLVRSDLMVANMVEASKNANAIFKFIKWTKGEIKLVDFLLGISEAKAAATANNSMELKVLKASKKRKKINGVGKFVNNEVFPSLSIIMTMSEVLQVKSICGVDLSQLYNALKLMNKYYLFSFGIYNPETQILQIIFDGDDDFAYTTIGTMRSLENKEVNAATTKDIMKIMSRV